MLPASSFNWGLLGGLLGSLLGGLIKVIWFQKDCLVSSILPKMNKNITVIWIILYDKGKYLSEALIFASNNPQYDDRLFIELQVQYIRIPSSEHVKNMLCTQIVFVFVLTFRTISCTQHVLDTFWAWNFHEQSFVIFWVSWCKNKCFWKRFTCTSNCFRSFFGMIDDTKKYFWY